MRSSAVWDFGANKVRLVGCGFAVAVAELCNSLVEARSCVGTGEQRRDSHAPRHQTLLYGRDTSARPCSLFDSPP